MISRGARNRDGSRYESHSNQTQNCKICQAKTEGGSDELLSPELRVPSFLSDVSGAGAISADWANRLLGNLSPGENIEGFKPPPRPAVMDNNNSEGRQQ